MNVRRHQWMRSGARDLEHRHLEYADWDEERDDIDAGEPAVEHGRERAGREDLANLRVALQPHRQIPSRALEEEGVGEVDEVLHEAERQLHVELRPERQEKTRAEERRE